MPGPTTAGIGGEATPGARWPLTVGPTSNLGETTGVVRVPAHSYDAVLLPSSEMSGVAAGETSHGPAVDVLRMGAQERSTRSEFRTRQIRVSGAP